MGAALARTVSYGFSSLKPGLTVGPSSPALGPDALGRDERDTAAPSPPPSRGQFRLPLPEPSSSPREVRAPPPALPRRPPPLGGSLQPDPRAAGPPSRLPREQPAVALHDRLAALGSAPLSQVPKFASQLRPDTPRLTWAFRSRRTRRENRPPTPSRCFAEPQPPRTGWTRRPGPASRLPVSASRGCASTAHSPAPAPPRGRPGGWGGPQPSLPRRARHDDHLQLCR